MASASTSYQSTGKNYSICIHFHNKNEQWIFTQFFNSMKKKCVRILIFRIRSHPATSVGLYPAQMITPWVLGTRMELELLNKMLLPASRHIHSAAKHLVFLLNVDDGGGHVVFSFLSSFLAAFGGYFFCLLLHENDVITLLIFLLSLFGSQ